jgi:hypothetical protein
MEMCFAATFSIYLTVMVKVSGQAPPSISVVTEGPWVVNVSKSSLKKHTSELEECNGLQFVVV